MSSAIVFAGPSLPPEHRPVAPGFVWHPPLRMGDLARVAAVARPAAIGVVDGVFEVVPTVWHKEILWAMAQGIPVYGAASIGALRAAELAPFGMRGVGAIFAAYGDGTLIDDDEVALLHGPEEAGFPPVTEAMVNVRATLDAARAAGVLAAADGARIAAVGKAFFYKARTWPALLEATRAAGVPSAARDALAAWLPSGRVDQKRRDALEMVGAIAANLAAAVAPLAVDYELAVTAALVRVCRAHL
jgi:hypothetical protein